MSASSNSPDSHLLESLLQTDHPLRAFLDNSPAVSWMKDAQGRHVFLSQPYLQKIGVPIDDWYGKTDFDLWPAEIASRFVADDRRVLENGDLLAFEDTEDVTFPNRKARTWWVVKFPITDARGQRFVGGIAIDISEQKNAEEERRQLEQEIARIVSDKQSRIGQDLHDGIGQELTALQLFASSLRDRLETLGSGDSPPAADVVKNMLPLAKRLVDGLIKTNENVRSMSHGLLPVNLDGRQLHAVLQDLVSHTSQIQGIVCRLPQCETIDFEDPVAATHLYRIAQEAINNAVKHSQTKTILVSLTRDDDIATLRVVDEGRGIDQSMEEQGSEGGMGIRIMKYRASLIGAELNINTTRSGGTTISCHLPLKGL